MSKRHRSQGVIINNFFTLATIVLMSAVIAIYTKYIVKEKPRVNSNLQCQKQILTTDKIFNQKSLNIMISLVKKGRYELDGGIIEAIKNKSIIKEKIRISEVDKYFIEALNILNINSNKTLVKIKYELIENDVAFSEKETTLNKGSIQTSFRINGKESFIMNTDFNTYDKKEIKERVLCTIEAFKYNESNSQ